jgi:hypothetical protein
MNMDNEMVAAKKQAMAITKRLLAGTGEQYCEQSAKKHKAFVRSRAIPGAEILLILVIFYGLTNFSLRTVSWFAYVGFGIKIGDQSLSDRFKNCASWLRDITLLHLSKKIYLSVPCATRIRIVDGTVLCRNGSTGTDYRIHVVFDPGSHSITSLEVTDAHGAEGLNQGIIETLSLVIGDRNFGRYREFKTAIEKKLALLARTHLQTQTTRNADGQILSPQHLTNLADQGLYDHQIQLSCNGQPLYLPARLIIIPLPSEIAGRARQKVRDKAKKKGKTPNQLAMHLAGYLCFLTTLSVSELSVEVACSLYRIRWQIECLIKRCKSIAKLGDIRGSDNLVQTQIWAKLLSICCLESERPSEASELPLAAATTGRPPALWRWLECLRMTLLGPLFMLASIGATKVSRYVQDKILRERSRKRGQRKLSETFPSLAFVFPLPTSCET